MCVLVPARPADAHLTVNQAGASRATAVDILSSRSLGTRVGKLTAKNTRSRRGNWRKEVPTVAAQTSVKLDSKLQKLVALGGAELVRVIIRVRPGTERKVASAIRRVGFKTHGKLPLIGSIVAAIPVGALEILANHPDVLGVSTDEMVLSQGAKKTTTRTKGRGNNSTTTSTTNTTTTTDTATTDTTTTTPLDENHLLNTLGLDDEPWAGAGINVAVIDSGIGFEDVPNQTAHLQKSWDFTDGREPRRVGDQQWPGDPYGHGTHVAGLIANSGWHTDGLYRGVAPEVMLFSLRVLDDQGAGYTSDVIRALSFIVKYQAQLKVDVINLSLGHPILEPAATDPLVQAVEAAVRSGIVVVVSAGNMGYNRDTGEVGYAGVTSPGNTPSAITAGALDSVDTDTRGDDSVARFSSRGPTWYDAFAKPDIVAPGQALPSTATSSSSILLDNPYLEVATVTAFGMPHIALSGTSMGAAVTTGVVALMLEASETTFERRLSPNAVKAILQYTALPLPGYDVLTQGAGGINADGALALASAIDPAAADGEWWLTVPATETSSIDSEPLVWGQRFIWGDRFIWGSTIYYADSTVWSPATVWGDRFIWGAQIDWSDPSSSVVWGDRFIWGSNIVWGDNLIGVDEGTEVLWGDRFIWGSVSPDRFIWGSLDDGTAGQTTVR
jgi:serine protease AprX